MRQAAWNDVRNVRQRRLEDMVTQNVSYSKKKAKINIWNTIFLDLILFAEKLKFFLQGTVFNLFPTLIGFVLSLERRVYFILCC